MVIPVITPASTNYINLIIQLDENLASVYAETGKNSKQTIVKNSKIRFADCQKESHLHHWSRILTRLNSCWSQTLATQQTYSLENSGDGLTVENMLLILEVKTCLCRTEN